MIWSGSEDGSRGKQKAFMQPRLLDIIFATQLCAVVF